MNKIFYSSLVLLSVSFSCQATRVNPVGAGSLMSQSEANSKCPKICERVGQKWNGQWKTIRISTMSVCMCEMQLPAKAMPGKASAPSTTQQQASPNVPSAVEHKPTVQVSTAVVDQKPFVQAATPAPAAPVADQKSALPQLHAINEKLKLDNDGKNLTDSEKQILKYILSKSSWQGIEEEIVENASFTLEQQLRKPN